MSEWVSEWVSKWVPNSICTVHNTKSLHTGERIQHNQRVDKIIAGGDWTNPVRQGTVRSVVIAVPVSEYIKELVSEWVHVYESR